MDEFVNEIYGLRKWDSGYFSRNYGVFLVKFVMVWTCLNYQQTFFKEPSADLSITH